MPLDVAALQAGQNLAAGDAATGVVGEQDHQIGGVHQLWPAHVVFAQSVRISQTNKTNATNVTCVSLAGLPNRFLTFKLD